MYLKKKSWRKVTSAETLLAITRCRSRRFYHRRLPRRRRRCCCLLRRWRTPCTASPPSAAPRRGWGASPRSRRSWTRVAGRSDQVDSSWSTRWRECTWASPLQTPAVQPGFRGSPQGGCRAGPRRRDAGRPPATSPTPPPRPPRGMPWRTPTPPHLGQRGCARRLEACRRPEAATGMTTTSTQAAKTRG